MMESYKVGPYTFTEEIDKHFKSPTGTMWRIQIDGKLIGSVGLSLEEAMALAIARKFDGANTRAHEYFLKGILPAEMMEHYK